MTIDRLLELHDLARQDGLRYERRRQAFEAVTGDIGRHHLGLVGPRGVGKTVLLRQYAAAHEGAFYLSMDALDPEDDPWDTLRTLHERYGYGCLLLDEVHFLPDATALLKRLYDFLDVRVVFTSSVALAMRASAHDLSRRVRLVELRTFSFREYLRFSHGLELEPLDLETVVDGAWSPAHLRVGRHFDGYLLGGGLLPYALDEPDPFPLLANILDKVVARDLPTVVRLAVDELDHIRRLLRFLGRSGVDGISYSSLSRNLGITKYKAEQYVDCLEQAFVVHRIMPVGTNVLREPKILLAPPCRLLYREPEDCIGGLREDYFVEALRQGGIPFDYLKGTRGQKTPDYLVTCGGKRMAVEVGGRSKGREQFKGVEVDRKVVFAHGDALQEGVVPLFMAGFLA